MATFLDLPAEIRNKIYFHTDLLFKGTRVVELNTRSCTVTYVGERVFNVYYEPEKNGTNETLARFPAQPAITKTCRKIRQETLPIFYGANRFEIRKTLDAADEAYISGDIYTPFPKLVFDTFKRIRAHIGLLTDVGFWNCEWGHSEEDNELLAALLDSDLDFKPAAIRKRHAILPNYGVEVVCLDGEDG